MEKRTIKPREWKEGNGVILNHKGKKNIWERECFEGKVRETYRMVICLGVSLFAKPQTATVVSWKCQREFIPVRES